jgi:serine/threonine protein kinase
MHSRNYIHRDIKPTNILIGHGDLKNTAFLIDFGIAKEFRDSATRAHIPFHQNHSFVGTPAFTSINHHLGFESGRRDDIESLAYTLIYLLCGSLPWFNKDTPSLSNDAILKLKQDIPAEILCCGIPLEFATLLTYSRSVKFAQKPDYNYLHALLQNCAVPPTPNTLIYQPHESSLPPREDIDKHPDESTKHLSFVKLTMIHEAECRKTRRKT